MCISNPVTIEPIILNASAMQQSTTRKDNQRFCYANIDSAACAAALSAALALALAFC